ncbi:hypothetical protein UFOVP1219_59 [uncultured Caudovirales phage]|uniref:Uncharacterized protein n=1 Tax=uncultured Caudovirales phage TaxID=2100421 RepID=A0A6J5MG88_9CAUD|nr:hypothetical protein UFOVP476_31 [uncultured Caudovirales phage]CAB4176545.1 hypothetical protein UFOVP986_44 [uncultured Caudovirales phage]CAB4191520.1 hypothetical protein UFOVP1219_59 [uncultured Caudovirales phage]CAB4223271.1 hypothetical protein UFOVP1671_34 [uncultured Caudovirales phage]CAB5220636.1 hypothetical protein UFOVP358_73 [uncultured Caudovirales phage]
MKKATKQGIGRTLNDKGISKTKDVHSRMVRGWSNRMSGWESKETETGFVVVWIHGTSTWGSRGKTDQEIADHVASREAYLQRNLDRIFDALTNKGYDARREAQAVVITNPVSEMSL